MKIYCSFKKVLHIETQKTYVIDRFEAFEGQLKMLMRKKLEVKLNHGSV